MIRFPGDVGQVSKIIASHASCPDWLQYSEVQNAKIDSGKILPHASLWRDLKVAHPSLVFPQSTMELILKGVAVIKEQENGWVRALTPVETVDFAKRMSKRMRSMARAINVTRAKHPKCGWLLRLFHDSSDADAADDAAEASTCSDAQRGGRRSRKRRVRSKQPEAPEPMKKPAAANEFFYGVDFELCQAWRQPAAGGSREYSEMAVMDGKTIQ